MKSIIETEDLPFFKLSDSQDLILFLIKKELQGTKFTMELTRLGFDSAVYSSGLGVVILSLVGFSSRSDELWDWFVKMIDSFAEKVDLMDGATAHELALDVYFELRTKLRFGE